MHVGSVRIRFTRAAKAIARVQPKYNKQGK